ncbi:c2H2-type domain-containing protein [Trichonephila clavipes]|nr:c2H2-type domain-containing protein [Trichonephila clavipes]
MFEVDDTICCCWRKFWEIAVPALISSSSLDRNDEVGDSPSEASKLDVNQKKIEVSVILENIRNDTLSRENLSRIHLTTRQDIKNIKRSFGLTNQRHADDATSVRLMLEEMAEFGTDNPILGSGMKNGWSLQGKLADGTVVEVEAGASFLH